MRFDLPNKSPNCTVWLRLMGSHLTALAAVTAALPALATYAYNAPPASDKQFGACVTFFNKHYNGSRLPSPVQGQSKSQAFCTCMWNETPEKFSGSLAKLAESPKGKTLNAVCEKHADWVN